MTRAGMNSDQVRWLPALLLLLSTPFASAQERTQVLALDTSRSYAEFEVKVLWLVGIHGRFGSMHGTITVDHFSNSAMVDARIDTNAVTMRSHSHEEWVKSPEFFDVQHYPQIQFVSDSIPLRRLQSGGEIEGSLTLRGINRRVRFELVAPSCLAMTGEDCPVEADGDIRRSDFGMSSHRGTLSDKVELHFSIYVTQPSTDANR